MKARGYPADVQIIQAAGKEVVLVGTAHVSKESTALVRRVIEQERPDTVCVELDPQRYKALTESDRWEKLDLKQVIRNKQLPTLLVNLLLASYQKRIAGKLGVQPGMELLEAARVAEELEIPVELVDRNIRVTFLRAWRSMGFLQKMKLLSAVMVSAFDAPEITEEEIEKLREKDVLSEMMSELAKAMPTLKEVLIDERDVYLAQKIREAPGARVVAVVGAGHAAGIVRELSNERTADLDPIREVPPATSLWKWIGWGVPAVIVGSLMWIGISKGGDVAGQNLMFWILANGIPACVGAVIALAHPLTILAAFAAAPLTSLTPVIGAGYVTAFVQAWVRPPLVRDFQTLSDDSSTFSRWWGNRLLRVFLAFLLPTLGSLLGTFVGGAEILSNLF